MLIEQIFEFFKRPEVFWSSFVIAAILIFFQVNSINGLKQKRNKMKDIIREGENEVKSIDAEISASVEAFKSNKYMEKDIK